MKRTVLVFSLLLMSGIGAMAHTVDRQSTQISQQSHVSQLQGSTTQRQLGQKVNVIAVHNPDDHVAVQNSPVQLPIN